MSRKFTRRSFLKSAAMAAGLAASVPILEACAAAATPTPVVIEKEKPVTVVVEKKVEVTKEVPKEVTKIVEKTVVVEKKVEVTKEVPKEVTKIVEKEKVVVVTATPSEIAPNNAVGVPYEKKDKINDGKPITVTIWDPYTGTSRDFMRKLAKEYMQMYPNVTLDVPDTTWDGYFAKLTASIPAGTGPDMFHFHNSLHVSFVWSDLFEPLPEKLFNYKFLEDNWYGFKEKHFHDKQGRPVYMPYGASFASNIFNVKMFRDAGLTPQDAPKTWDDVIKVSEKMAKRDEKDRLTQVGWVQIWHQGIWMDMQYQQGRYMFTRDGKKAQIDTPESRKALQWQSDYVFKLKLDDPTFLAATEAFTTEKGAMIWGWNWAYDYFTQSFPALEWDAAPMPTWTGKPSPAQARMNYEVGFVVNKGKPAEVKAVAFDFLHFVHGIDDHVVDEAIMMGVPCYFKLRDHYRIRTHRLLSVQTPLLDRCIFPGQYAPSFASSTNVMSEAVFLGGKTVDEAVKAAQAEADAKTPTEEKWWIETNYVHDKEMIQA